MNDLILRQAAIDALGEEPLVWNDGEDEIAERNQWRRDVNAIKALPPAQEWIPCSEQLPGEDESFYVLCCDKHGEITIGHLFESDESETLYSAENEYEYMYNCVAWMPLPKPWKGDQDGEN